MTQKYFEKSSTKVKQPHNGYNTIVGFSINKIYNKLADYKFYNLLFFINP